MPRNALVGSAHRRQRILGLVNERGDTLVSELKALFGVSEVTVRSDLAALASRGLVVRTHGGAASPAGGLGFKALDLTFATRDQSNVELKARIGAAAAELIQNGQSVMLDASTTGLQLARAMRRQPPLEDVTVITD